MKRKYLVLVLLPLLVVSFLSVGLLTTAQVDTSVLSMGGKDWSIKVDSSLQTSIDSKAVPKVEVSKAGAEKELFLTLNSLKDCVSGQIEFKVSATGLTVYKQLPLNEELTVGEQYDFINVTHAMLKDKVVVYRPENVVNSFACFDSDGKKVLHIYASKLIDAKGNSVWVDSDLKDGLLTVYLDQKWLAEAVFPVLLDPTFGYTTQGGSSAWMTGTFGIVQTSPADISTVDDIKFYLEQSNAASGGAGVYDNSENLLVSSLTSAYSDGLNTRDIVDTAYAQSTEIYLAVGNATDGIKAYYDTATSIGWYIAGNLPSSISTKTVDDRAWSIYADYTIGEGEPTPTPTPSPSPSPSPSPTPVLEGELSDTQWFAGALIFILVIFNIVLFMLPFALMRFVFAVVSLALCALAFAYAVPFSPYLQLLGCLVSVLSMYFASRARE